MGIFRRSDGETMTAADRPLSTLTAAAANINLKMPSSWQFFALGDRRWQWEIWRHYDINPELRFVTNWLAAAVSRCRMYAAQLDKNDVPGDETEQPMARAIVHSMFGGPGSKAEAQRLMALGLQLPGEAFIVAESGDGTGRRRKKRPDFEDPAERWYVASTSEVQRKANRIVVTRSFADVDGDQSLQYTLEPGKDLLTRLWSPHPRRRSAADSSCRAVLPTLREMERLTQRVFSEIDSRLAGAGLLLLPSELTLPQAPPVPGQPQLPPSLTSFQHLLEQVMSTALQAPESAAARVPISIQGPGEHLDKIKHLMLESGMTEVIIKLREMATTRLARTLDVPPEILLGTGDISHWSAWAVEESSIKLHVEPVLARMADALTRGFMLPALKVAGVKDPSRYCVWFDVSPLAVRPNRSDQALQFMEQDLLSDEAARRYGAFDESDKPDDKERAYRLLEKIVIAQPALVSDPVVAKALGLPTGITNPAAPPPMPGGELGAAPGANPDDPEALIKAIEAGTEPADGGGAQGPPAQRTGAPPANSRTASGLLVCADAAVRRALEIAGGRIVPARDRGARYPDVPRGELHTRVIPTADRIPALLASAWDGLPASLAVALVDVQVPRQRERVRVSLAADLDTYAQALLEQGHPHDAELLRGYLGARGYPV